jgi:hypothetical protein
LPFHIRRFAFSKKKKMLTGASVDLVVNQKDEKSEKDENEKLRAVAAAADAALSLVRAGAPEFCFVTSSSSTRCRQLVARLEAEFAALLFSGLLKGGPVAGVPHPRHPRDFSPFVGVEPCVVVTRVLVAISEFTEEGEIMMARRVGELGAQEREELERICAALYRLVSY